MKKFLVLFFALFLVGCGNTKKEATPAVTEPSESKEVEIKEIDLKVYLPDYNVEDKTFTIKGKATPKTEVTLSGAGEDMTTTPTITGSFEFEGNMTDEEFEIVISDGKTEEKTTIKSVDTVLAEIKAAEEEAERKRKEAEGA